MALYPLLGAAADPLEVTASRRADLETEKARLIEEIHELELDYATGKLSEPDYRAVEGRLKARAVDVMRALDADATEDRSSG